MPNRLTEPASIGGRRAEQVAVLLDDRARILNVNTGLAGSTFLGLATKKQSDLHNQLHPGCNGECRFQALWKKARRELASNDSMEWEIDDPILGKVLRLNLARAPSAQEVEVERRRGQTLLSITDITLHRREYESLVRRERTLVRLLQEKGVDPEEDRVDDLPATVISSNFRSLDRLAILAQEEERRRIATELHDSLAQSAGVIKYAIEASVARLSQQDADIDPSELNDVVDQVRTLVDEIRRISNNLAPSMLEDFGLCAALRGLCSEFRSAGRSLHPCCDTCVDESQLPDVVRFTIYRVAQEALNNMAKHSSATEASVDLRMSDGGVRLTIRDNGEGFDTASDGSSRSFGLRNMRERVNATGGELSIESAPGKGVLIDAVWSGDSLALLRDETVLYGVDGNG